MYHIAKSLYTSYQYCQLSKNRIVLQQYMSVPLLLNQLFSCIGRRNAKAPRVTIRT